ncbi:MerR family transcriptional regulator [Aeromicrobium sp. CF4.19]|uniref:MerR family transcriptional regulator n=1 Tax=Aeromicrobium sp. CF4.19 TaxID=3373082 RepID=UPI003EE66B26
MSTTPLWETDQLWSVGEVARRLELPASTVRTWERRYGIGPTARSSGGHRRYVAEDAVRLQHMSSLVSQGVSAAEAARIVHRAEAAGTTTHDSLDEPSEFTNAVVVAARAYDSMALNQLVSQCLQDEDVATAWTTKLAPTLRRVGEEWSTGGLGVGGEHLVSDSIVAALRSYTHVRTTGPTAHRPILLASAEDDQHALPLLALQAALADEGVFCHVLGARTPASSVAGITLRIDPAAVFLWASLPRVEGDTLSRVVTAAAERSVVLLGGPGWGAVDTGDARLCQSITGALEAVRDALDQS